MLYYMKRKSRMESNLESRLKNLNRIKSLLIELRSTAPEGALWRPLLQAVIELSGEFKDHVQELRDKELKAAELGRVQQNGTVEKINGTMPTLAPEVSIFDYARSLRLNRNQTPGNKTVVNANSEQPAVNGHAEPDAVSYEKVENNFKGENKAQGGLPKAKLQITSNIRQLYSIRRKPKIPPSEVVRATATRRRSKSRSPSPQQLLNTIITKAFIEPTPRPERELALDVQVPNSPETASIKCSKIQNDTEDKATKQSDDDDDILTQGNKTCNANDTDIAKTTVNDETKEAENSVIVIDDCNSNLGTSDVLKCPDTGSALVKSKSRINDAKVTNTEKGEKKEESNIRNWEIALEVESEKESNSKLQNGKTSNRLQDDKFQSKTSEVEDKSNDIQNKSCDSNQTARNTNENTENSQRNNNHGKAKDVKSKRVTKRVSVLLKDIRKCKHREEGKGQDVNSDFHPTGPKEDNFSKPKTNWEKIKAENIKKMEDILAKMLKRHKIERKESHQPEKSFICAAEPTKTEKASKTELKVEQRPPIKCRTKAMLLQKLRQSSSLENLTRYTEEVDTTVTKSKTDDHIGTGSWSAGHAENTRHSSLKPAVNVRAFTQPIKDPAHEPHKSAQPVVWSPPTKHAPVIKARSRKHEVSSKEDPDFIPAKISKQSRSKERQSDDTGISGPEVCRAPSGKSESVSVTKSKAYQEFVHGLYEVDNNKSSNKDKCTLPPEGSFGGPNIDIDSLHSHTSGGSSRDSDCRSSSSENIRRSKRSRVPKYYGPDMFLIDDAMLVNYKVLKPHFEGNFDSPQKKKSKRSTDNSLDFLQYEGEHTDSVNVKPKKSRNSKHAFTITSARKNTSAYQLKNVEVRLQKMSIDEEGNIQRTGVYEKGKYLSLDDKAKSPQKSLFSKGIDVEAQEDEIMSDGEKADCERTSSSDTSQTTKDKKAVPKPCEDDDDFQDTADLDDVFPTPGSSSHRSTVESDLSESILLLDDADERENEKENDVDAAKHLLEEEKSKERHKDRKVEAKKESWRGRPAELHFRSTLDVSIDLTSDDELTDNTSQSMKKGSVFSTSESEREFSTSKMLDSDLHHLHNRRKHKNPKKVYKINDLEQLQKKYSAIKYGGSLSSPKKEQPVNSDSDSTAAGCGHDSSASTAVFPDDKNSSIDKNVLDTDDNNDQTITTSSDSANTVAQKGDSKQAISAWNNSVYETFDKAIDLCLRSKKEMIAMKADRDTDQESLHLQLDMDEPSDENRTPVAKETKSQSDANINYMTGTDKSSFHFLNKDGSVVGRIKRETYASKRSASSDRILDKAKSSPHVMVNDFNVVIKVMIMLQDFMKDDTETSLNVTSLPVKQHKMLEEICKICHLDVVTDTNRNKLVIKNRASSPPSMKDLAKISSW